MTFGTLLCWAAWGMVITNIDPTTSGWIGLGFFYGSLFLGLVGTASVVGFLIRKSIYKDTELVFRQLRRTFRQSIILGVLVIICMELLRREWLYWWSAVLLMLLGLTIEGMIFTKRKFSTIEI